MRAASSGSVPGNGPSPVAVPGGQTSGMGPDRSLTVTPSRYARSMALIDAPPGTRVPGISHPAVVEWFTRRFPEGPTPPQEEGWVHIAAGRDTLIAAPTGSGKTLAGFLVCIDRLYRAHAAGRDVEGMTQVAYVSPLRALAVDIAENLERPLAEIAEVAAGLGLAAPELTVAVRTGDTSQSERALMVRRPPNFLVTTPESLYLMVTAARSRAVLRTVETVIVDEIHATARDKRGSHLTLTLERLERATDRRPQRIGLSATQRPIELLAGMLCGAGAPGATAIVDTGHRRELDLALELPQGELEAIWSSSTPAAWPSAWPTSSASASATTSSAPTTAPCRRTGATGWSPGCGPATSRPWWPRPPSSSGSTSARSTSSARSARPAASPPSSSGSAGRATAAAAPPRAASSR